jgi:hypothetical protein
MKRDKITLKSYFETGDIPTQSQYENLIDSLRHLDDSVPSSQVVFEGYREQNSRPMDLLVELGDFDDSNFGTKLLVNDADQEIIMDGSLVFRSTTQGGAVLIQQPSNAGLVSLQLPTVSGKLITDTADNHFLGTQSFDGSVSFDGFIEFGSNVTFQNPVQFVDEVTTHGITSNSHIKLKNNAWLWSQYSAAHDELRLNANTAGGWDFYNQTQTDFANIRAKGAEFTASVNFQRGLVSDEAIKLNGSVSYVYDTDDEILAGSDSGGYYLFTGTDTNIAKPIYIGDNATFIRFKTSDFERYRIDASGNHDFKSGNASFGGITFMHSLAETDRRLTFNGNVADTYNIYYYDEGSDDFHPVIIGGNSDINTGLKVFSNGDAQPSGTYKSSDGTPGHNGSFTVGTFTITVKDGLITDVVDIS